MAHILGISSEYITLYMNFVYSNEFSIIYCNWLYLQLFSRAREESVQVRPLLIEFNFLGERDCY